MRHYLLFVGLVALLASCSDPEQDRLEEQAEKEKLAEQEDLELQKKLGVIPGSPQSKRMLDYAKNRIRAVNGFASRYRSREPTEILELAAKSHPMGKACSVGKEPDCECLKEEELNCGVKTWQAPCHRGECYQMCQAKPEMDSKKCMSICMAGNCTKRGESVCRGKMCVKWAGVQRDGKRHVGFST